MRLLIISDVHGNLSALESVLDDSVRFSCDAVAMLGDAVDYGMRSNEVVSLLARLELPAACVLWGNHEAAVMKGDYSRFSSERGARSAARTAASLSQGTREWLDSLPGKAGMQEFSFAGKRFLAVHGSIDDPLWGVVAPGHAGIRGYEGFDVVLSGHSHVPHAFSLFHDVDDPAMRNKRRVDFVNPGSVGQPRNHCAKACYAVWDSDSGVSLVSVPYPVESEQAFYDGSVDDFYRARLSLGV